MGVFVGDGAIFFGSVNCRDYIGLLLVIIVLVEARTFKVLFDLVPDELLMPFALLGKV